MIFRGVHRDLFSDQVRKNIVSQVLSIDDHNSSVKGVLLTFSVSITSLTSVNLSDSSLRSAKSGRDETKYPS